MKHSFCEDWEFTRHWTEAFGKGLPVPKQQAVRLPHTCRAAATLPRWQFWSSSDPALTV